MSSLIESGATASIVPVTLLTVSYLITLRRGWAWFSGRSKVEDVNEEEAVEGEEDIIPKPEPLGGVLSPRNVYYSRPKEPSFKHARQLDVRSRPASPSPFSFEKQRYELPLDLDAKALRAKLIDADAAKRRAMTRLAELERETENLKIRCAELERKAVVAENVQSLSKMVADSLQSLGLTQRLLAIAVPQLKYRGRGVMWMT